MEDDPIAFQVLSTGLDNLCEVAIEGVGKTNMTNHSLLEESERSDAFGAIDDLIREDEVHRLDLLLQGADGSESDNAAHTDMTQGGYVGTVGDLMRCKLMVNAMASKEGNIGSLVGKNLNRGRRGAPRCDGVQSSDRLEAFKLAQASAANHSNVNGLYSQESEVLVAIWRNDLLARTVEGVGKTGHLGGLYKSTSIPWSSMGVWILG